MSGLLGAAALLLLATRCAPAAGSGAWSESQKLLAGYNPNLISHPNFASPGTGGNAAAGWSSPAALFSIDKSAPHWPAPSSLKLVVNQSNLQGASQTVEGMRAGRTYAFSIATKSKDLNATDDGATACLEFHGPTGDWLGGHYSIGGTRGTMNWTVFSAEVTIPNVGKTTAGVSQAVTSVSFMAYVRGAVTGTAWFSAANVTQLGSPFDMTTNVVRPVYRGRITNQTSHSMRIDVRAHLSFGDFDPSLGSTLQVVSSLRSVASGLPIETITAGPPVGSVVDLNFNATCPRSLPAGTYNVTTVLRNATTAHVIQTTWHKLTRVADSTAEPKVWIDDQQRTIVNGQPFFPLGMYTFGISEQDIANISQTRLNFIMPYGCPINTTTDQGLNILDLVHTAGLKVAFDLKGTYFGNPEGWVKPVTSRASERSVIEAQIDAYRAHPAILAWYLNDELPEKWIPDLDDHYRWAVARDSDHPCWSVLFEASQLRQYLASFDVVGLDPYPVVGPLSQRQAAGVGNVVDIGQNQIDASRPLWEVVQAQNMANYGPCTTGCRTPSLAEERSMAWQSVVRGANGVAWYSLGDLQRNKDVPYAEGLGHIASVAAELDRFAPILLSDDGAAPAATVDGNASTWTRTRARWFENAYWLFAANDGRGEGETPYTLQLPHGLSIGSVQVISEQAPHRQLNRTSALRFVDHVRAFDVKVYRITIQTGGNLNKS